MDYHCESRVANFYGDFEAALRRYSDRFRLIAAKGHISTYMFFQREGEDSYLFHAVHGGTLPLGQGHNTEFTIGGPREERVKELMAGFEERLMMETREDPSVNYQNAQLMKVLFENR